MAWRTERGGQGMGRMACCWQDCARLVGLHLRLRLARRSVVLLSLQPANLAHAPCTPSVACLLPGSLPVPGVPQHRDHPPALEPEAQVPAGQAGPGEASLQAA